MKRSLSLYISYFCLLLVDLALLYIDPAGDWRPLLEPIMMALLLLYFNKEYKLTDVGHPRLIQIAISALILGGFFLMKVVPLYSFPVGFCFFLVANISYTLMFYRYADMNLKLVIPFISIASIMAIALLFYFHDVLGNYLLPAAFYIFVLLNCVQAAFLRYKMVTLKSFKLVFIGATLFFFAQVTAAVHYFLNPQGYLLSMMIALFFISQILIIKGILSNAHQVKSTDINTEESTSSEMA